MHDETRPADASLQAIHFAASCFSIFVVFEALVGFLYTRRRGLHFAAAGASGARGTEHGKLLWPRYFRQVKQAHLLVGTRDA
jgi:hypothetical protein